MISTGATDISSPPSTNIVDRAAYDPGSGLVTGPDGTQYFLGSDGGQAAGRCDLGGACLLCRVLPLTSP